MSLFNLINGIKSMIKTSDNKQLDRQREIVTRLKFISTFQEGDKIDINNLKIEQNNIFTPLKRMILGESRDKTFMFLGNTVERSFEIIQSYINSERTSEKIYCSNIANDLIKSIDGFKNLQKTYKDDKLFICNIDTLLEYIEAKLIEINEKHPDVILIKSLSKKNIISIIND